ncbi:potassium channel SKOR-like isoform X2 [Cucurbita pepo subsp. pepo]|uniref:potassium channel SKOR-like isoform X2 n=1 Tax=Cucurbita pepo subsp. pepo TaxID=3664 RepID=UPI000C9DA694|nr:potassium channel SKOR-like isoform X2 [Cucurbita pepo subsp. pepo]
MMGREREGEMEEDFSKQKLELDGYHDNGDSKLSCWKRKLTLLSLDSSIRNGERSTDAGKNNSANFRSLNQIVIHPHDWRYVLWTHFILVWAVYSSFFTPLEFGFFRGLPKNLFLLDVAGQIAFLIDIAVHFCVAYRDSHSYRFVYDRNLIAIRYLKSRFVVDLMGCMPWDAIYKASGKKELVRYLLWIRLSRALRVTEFFEKLEKDIRINYLGTRIAKLFVVELYCTHTAACIFYYLATTLPPSKEGYTWIGSLKLGDYSYSNFREIDLWKRYITSLYFAVVTMATVGYGDMHAVNVREMIFIMIFISFDMILGSYLLGNMAALIVKGSKTEKFRDKMKDVIKYVNKNKLNRKLSKDIKDHLQLQYCNSSEFGVLQDIPASIRAKISQKLYEPYIKEVSLFKGCSQGFIKRIATKVREEAFFPGQMIIERENLVDQLYVVCHGELEEIENWDTEDEELIRCLGTYSSFGEISFLCNSPHPYHVRVREFSKILQLDKLSFKETLELHFLDGQIILDNALEGKDSNQQDQILESDIILYIQKRELELAIKVNCAAHDGDLNQLKRLIKAGADPNKTDYDGRSPLHFAASKGYEAIACFLIEQGAEVNVPDKFGNMPLLEAIQNGHEQVGSLLAKAGATIVANDAGGLLCSTVARRDLGFLKGLLANGIDPNARNYDQRTPLHIAVSEGLYPFAEVLLNAGASVFATDRWGNTPLDEARTRGNKNLIRLLEVARIFQSSENNSDISEEIQGTS